MIYIGNTFSLGMVAPADLHRVRFAPCQRPERIMAAGRYTSAVGHADTAALLGVPMSRVSVKLAVGDWLYVAQIQGPPAPWRPTEPSSWFAWISVSLASDGETA
jgi:hypothetical protein